MGRKPRHLCMRCGQKLPEGQSFCEHCGSPTVWASHDEKVEWELEQYEIARLGTQHQEFEKMQTAPPPTRRRVKLRSAPPLSHSPEPKRAPSTPAPSSAPLPAANDAAVLVKVMRLLNERISELEARIAELESETTPDRRASEGR